MDNKIKDEKCYNNKCEAFDERYSNNCQRNLYNKHVFTKCKDYVSNNYYFDSFLDGCNFGFAENDRPYSDIENANMISRRLTEMKQTKCYNKKCKFYDKTKDNGCCSSIITKEVTIFDCSDVKQKKCTHCEFISKTFLPILKRKDSTNREYWLMTELFVYLHDGKDFCAGISKD